MFVYVKILSKKIKSNKKFTTKKGIKVILFRRAQKIADMLKQDYH